MGLWGLKPSLTLAPSPAMGNENFFQSPVINVVILNLKQISKKFLPAFPHIFFTPNCFTTLNFNSICPADRSIFISAHHFQKFRTSLEGRIFMSKSLKFIFLNNRVNLYTLYTFFLTSLGFFPMTILLRVFSPHP